jgi:hypothetical protein
MIYLIISILVIISIVISFIANKKSTSDKSNTLEETKTPEIQVIEAKAKTEIKKIEEIIVKDENIFVSEIKHIEQPTKPSKKQTTQVKNKITHKK